MPYQWRHSGPSADIEAKRRTAEQVQKRGRWQVARTVQRYERHSRLGLTWASIEPAMRRHMLECGARLAEVFVAGAAVCRLGPSART